MQPESEARDDAEVAAAAAQAQNRSGCCCALAVTFDQYLPRTQAGLGLDGAGWFMGKA